MAILLLRAKLDDGERRRRAVRERCVWQIEGKGAFFYGSI
jgi:hypothetical protein